MRQNRKVTLATASVLLVVATQFLQAQVTDNARFLTLAPATGFADHSGHGGVGSQ